MGQSKAKYKGKYDSLLRGVLSVTVDSGCGEKMEQMV